MTTGTGSAVISRQLHRRAFVRRLGGLAGLFSVAGSWASVRVPAKLTVADADLELLREMAAAVIGGSRVLPGTRIPGGPENTTGHILHVPGATQNYYPAFWVRDAAMMLGADFISAEELAGWIRVIAATQPGADGLRFGRLSIPPYSIPDHITLGGKACWFPGAYEEQGNGSFGFLPPADDAFYFIHMVHAHWQLTRQLALFAAPMRTSWGEPRLAEVCVHAFESVHAETGTGLVRGEVAEGRTRVDWGFCDTIRKAGFCLMPSLLRFQAARELAALFRAAGEAAQARRYRDEAARIQAAIPRTFYRSLPGAGRGKSGLLLSATELGRKDDVWAAAFAVTLGVLPPQTERAVARHLLALCEAGGTTVEGQVRHLPPVGEWGGFWEKAGCEPDQYQNGGYWGTPTGWLVVALRKVSPVAADRLLREYADHLRANRGQGAPWEWIKPARNLRVNPRYAASVGLVYVSLAADAGHPKAPRKD